MWGRYLWGVRRFWGRRGLLGMGMGIREGLLKGEMRGGGRVLEGLEGGVDGGYGELGWFGCFGSWVLANLACIGLLME